MDSSVIRVSGCGARGWGFDSPTGPPGEKSQPGWPWASCTVPGRPLEEENNKPLMSTLYLENLGKGHPKLELELLLYTSQLYSCDLGN